MHTPHHTNRLWVRLVILGLGIGSAIAYWPTANPPIAQNDWQNPTVQQTSLEFILERKY